MLVNSISAVIDALARAPDVVIPLVREVPASVLKRRPTPTKWSAHEHACHLAAVHGLFLKRLDVFLAEPSPVITPYDPGTDDADDALLEEDLDRSLAAFVEDRVRLVSRLRGLSTDVWSKTAEHGEYSPLFRVHHVSAPCAPRLLPCVPDRGAALASRVVRGVECSCGTCGPTRACSRRSELRRTEAYQCRFAADARCYADVMDAPRVHPKVTSRSYGIHG